MSAQSTPFKLEKQGHVAWLIMNRPEKINAMTESFFRGLGENFKALDEDPEVRVVVIKGEGKHFTSGLDLFEAASLVSDDSAAGRETLRLKIIQAQESFSALERCRKPVIGAAHNRCVGGGVDLMCACDIRMASKDAIFTVMETRLAMIADLGTLQRLPHIVGHGMARELAFTGRDFTADEALSMGFITHICPDSDALFKKAGDLAEEIASCPPMAVQGTKETMIHARDKGVYPSLEYVAQKNASAIFCEDMTEAVTAFMEKRKPVYKGR
ncbi:Enoyl-CoA hydratase [Candidatus Desulfarcum epimagneticum]|uniref:Enoyl-CoA hydratase n=1 Tax=uncultured Desulfobacteraceae bacterium TaxID=218296 RepID=A0A484HF83_9BACT|nr:Enoyl-CoA hydratase [uncultured Desulfobacteraceae bacterium]